MSYICATCHETHDDLPDIGTDKPDQYWDVPEDERETRIKLTEDTCILDDEHFFIRGVIEIPIHDYPERFGFGVWVSQKKENFDKYREHPDSDEIGPFFGWLCTKISYFEEDTLFLKTMAYFQSGNQRPKIELEPIEHPLAIYQRDGITLDKAWEIVHFYLDGND